MSNIEEEFLKIEKECAWNTIFNKIATDHYTKTSHKKYDTALFNMNRALNRFRDVLPYDDTRVCLTRGSNDYINANYVQVPAANRKYILTQGPLQATSGHFWQMVWEQNSRVIIMLTHLVEKGCNKCWLYYPDYQNDSEIIFDDVDLKVTFVSDRQYRYYTQRKFELINLSTGESRPIVHWSDFDWPDHGAPKNPGPFLQLLGDVRHCGAFDVRYGPPILHCSAGIGRSGTFVLVDSILKTLAHTQTPSAVSLMDVLAHIRMQRYGLIQTPEQLRFSYIAVIAGLKNLNEIEQTEGSFIECSFNLSSDSESDGDDENNFNSKRYPKVCRRQDNVMPNGRLSDVFDDINCELIKRVDSNASSYQPSPKSTRRLQSLSGSKLSSEDLKQLSPPSKIVTPHDVETSLRLRQERLTRNDAIEKKVNEMKTKLHEQSSSMFTNNDGTSLFKLLTTKYRRPVFIGILTLFTGSLMLYKQALFVQFYYKFSLCRAGLTKHSLAVDEHGLAAFSYSEKGSRVQGKPSIVFVHGVSSNKDTWIPIIKHIPNHYHCITIDLPGHGETVGLNEDRYSIDKFVEKLKLFFDKMHLTENICIIGASMGGAIVAMFAVKYPEYVSMMCLLAPPANEQYETDLIRKIKSGDSTALIPETPEQLRDMINELTVKQVNMPGFFINGFLDLRLRCLNEHKKVLNSLIEDEKMFTTERHLQLKHAHCPTLVLWGRQDKLYIAAGADYFCKLLPNAKSIILDECGHFMAIDKPQEVAECIVIFHDENFQRK
ncbi:unnamed protein product [Rotaria magnacalcarata]|uniref:protein-tyrosine-phosphatase n=1 Tax=Rotaria magnacalcarata TaxID=392030 RepID=A0A817ABN5_9BILA|nr:unnamed protein product [Rotaria magnacalcarata]